jgi:hypothetical protein
MRFWEVLSHPITSIVLTSALAILLYFLSKKDIRPRYYVSNAALLAEALDEEPALQIIWNGEMVPNVRSCIVIIWNAGRQFLDSSNVASTDPIAVNLEGAAKLLRARVMRTSRDALQFHVEIVQSSTPSVQRVAVRFADEALEQGDGVMVHILFVGDEHTRISVNGRIKGAPQGFAEAPVPRLGLTGRRRLLTYMVAAIGVVSIIGGIINFYHGVAEFRADDIQCWFCTVSGLGMFLLGLWAAYHVASAFQNRLSWVYRSAPESPLAEG